MYLSAYLARTEVRRAYHQKAEGFAPKGLFISNTKPYQSVQPSTLAKWLLVAMEAAGIDTATYKAHSTRSSSSTDLVRRGLSVSQIKARVFWSERSQTFGIFYNRA